MITEILLKDRTTGQNILWANSEYGAKEIRSEDIQLIRPRHEKNREHQKSRTKNRAEIFTPPEICKIQNDLIDADKKLWTDYVDAKFLEITCGEAPYLVNLYNAVTGEPIKIENRVGLLDRKLRVVNCETKILPDWTEWTLRAVQSVYGYEFQGDNLFLARQNVYQTVVEYFKEKFSYKPPEDFLIKIAEIISWNLWQMNGLTNAIPYANINHQGSLEGFGSPVDLHEKIYCRIKDWSTGDELEYRDLLKGAYRRNCSRKVSNTN